MAFGTQGGAAPRSTPRHNPTKPAAAAAPAGPQFYTATQLMQMAAQMAAQQQQPQMDLLAQQRLQAQQQAAAELAAIQGFSKARAALSANVGPEIGANFQNAANQTAVFGKGFSTDLQNQLGQSAGQTNDYLANVIHAPAGQQVGPQEAQGAADTLYALGGYLPAQTFAQQGAAFKSAADFLPEANFGAGQSDLVAAMNRGHQSLADLDAQTQALLANRPNLIQSALSNLQSAQTSQQRLGIEQRGLDLRVASQRSTDFYRRAQLGLANRKETYQEWLSQKKLGLAAQNQTFNQWAKQQGLQIQGQRVVIAQQNADTASAKFRWAQQTWTANYGLALQRLGIAKKSLQLSVLAQEKKLAGGGFSPAQVQKYKGTSFRLAENAFNGFTDAKGKTHPPLDYQQAVIEGRKEGIPLSILTQSLNELYPAGQRGRPAEPLSPAQQSAVNQATSGFGRGLAIPGKGSAAAETAAPTRSLQAAYSREGAGGVYRAPWNQTLDEQTRSQIAAQAIALGIGEPYVTPQNIAAFVGRMGQESGGQTAVVNKWDSNWRAGTPSIGLMQTIPSTFNKYALPGHTNIWDPLDNAIAAARYMRAVYGRIVGPSGSGY